jgi:hypothetical protein
MASTLQDTITIKFEAKGEQNLIKAINELDQVTKKLTNTQAKLQTKNKSHVSQLTKMQKTLRSQGASWMKVVGSVEAVSGAYKGNAVDIARLKSRYEKFQKTLQSTNATTTTATSKTNKQTQSLFSLGHSARQTGGAFSVLRSKLLLVNFALALGVRQIMRFTAESAKLNSMHRSFTSLSGSTLKASVSLTKLKEATNDTMSEFDLFQQANNAMILGVSDNSDEMAGMFDMAQRLGDALGKGTRESVESLITGIGRQSKLMLDNIGIMVQSQKAYDDYAEVLKITTDDLSDIDKKQAFLNATMAAGVEKLKKLPPEVINAQKQFEQLSASIENLSARIGNVLIPVLGGGTRAMTGFVNSIDDKKIVLLISTAEALATSFVVLRGSIALGTIAVNALAAGVGVLGATLLATGIPALVLALSATLTAMYNIVNQQALAFIKLQDGIKGFKNELISLSLLFDESKGTIAEWEKANADIAQKMRDETAKKIKEANIEILQLAIGLVSRKRDILNKEMQDRHFIILQARAKERDLHNKSARESLDKDAKNDDDYRQSRVAKQKELHEEMIQNEFNMLANRQNIRTEFWTLTKAEHEKRLAELKKIEEDEGLLLDAQRERLKSHQQLSISALGEFLSAWRSNMQARMDSEISTLKDSEAYKSADAERRTDMERNITKGYKDEQMKQFRIGQAVAIADIAMSTSSAIMKSVAGAWVSIGQPWAGIIASLGLLQAGMVMTQKPPSFEQGGLVGGSRHSQGGTMIEAEQGEFIMSRSAVQSIGTSALNQMNQGGGGGITLNISAPLIDETIIDTIIPAIQKAQRMNLA